MGRPIDVERQQVIGVSPHEEGLVSGPKGNAAGQAPEHVVPDLIAGEKLEIVKGVVVRGESMDSNPVTYIQRNSFLVMKS